MSANSRASVVLSVVDMCGITGYVETHGFDSGKAEATIYHMAAKLAHRGPDDSGHWIDADHGVVLGHRRLAVVELSEAGRQPMASASGRYVMVFNGEIYDHEALRAAVRPAPAWRGRSDTESLLAGFEAFGIAATFARSTGMFAAAVWDREARRLTLARDRLGEKPLYYGWQGSTFLFGSELKALAAHPDFQGHVDDPALAAYLKYGYVPAPHSIYDGIRKLLPGTTLTLAPAQRQVDLVPDAYWSLAAVAERGAERPFSGSDEEAVSELERLMETAIRGQLMSDVPLGAFLSGGIDSSAVVALMQRVGGSPVRTFTIGFSETAFDESRAARDVAHHLGTHHSELLVTPAKALEVIPRLPTIYDEPFGDASAIPTWLLAGLARREVTVALSGDGGDELFAGYGRYRRTSRLWSRVASLPPLARRAGGLLLSAVPDALIQRGMMRYSVGDFPNLFSDRVRGFRTAFAADQVDALYDVRVSNWPDPASVLKTTTVPSTAYAALTPFPRAQPTERMMGFDTLSYLPDDVLVKVDRAAMALSLETRVPLLDHRVVEFAWSLPHRFKVRDGEAKWLLKRVLHRHVPPDLVDRPKQGFGVPIHQWLRGPLRTWAEDLLATDALEGRGPFRAAPIRELWQQHLAGRADWQHRLWPVLMYQEWDRTRRG